MRKFIISFSILFFALSGIITFRALEIPVSNTGYQGTPKDLPLKDSLPEPENIIRKSDPGLAAEGSKNKLSNKDEADRLKVDETGKSGSNARVLAVLGNGVFRTGQVFIEENMVNAVNEIIPEIFAFPGHRVIIEGHTSSLRVKSSAGEQYLDNRELSLFRASAVARVLVKKGIPVERISVVGYGSTRPITSNDTYEGRVKNRRVEIKLIPADRGF